jgi:DNA modification methylase
MVTPYYEDEHVRLFHGDCREITDWLEADVLVTDPPYGIAWRQGGLHSLRSTWSTATQSIVNDESTAARDDAMIMWGKQRPAIVFGSWREARPADITHRLIWHKAGRKPGVAPAAWFPTDEEIYLIGSGWVGSPMGTVLRTDEAREREPGIIGHPTPKPVRLMETLILKAPPGIIADPFAGSGTTLLAARNLGRRTIGIELEERYCEIAARRLSQGVLDFGGAA